MRLLWLKMYAPIVDFDPDAAPVRFDAPSQLDSSSVSEELDDAATESHVAPPRTMSVRHLSADPPTVAVERTVSQSVRELRFGHPVPAPSLEAS
jgi:hypothetical protein